MLPRYDGERLMRMAMGQSFVTQLLHSCQIDKLASKKN